MTVFPTKLGFSSTSIQSGSLNYHHLMLEPSSLALNHLAYSSFNTILTKSFKKIPITLKLISKVSSFKYSKHIFATSLQNKMINSFKFSMSTIWSLWLLLFYLSTCFNNFSFDNLVFDGVYLPENMGYFVFSPHLCYPRRMLETDGEHIDKLCAGKQVQMVLSWKEGEVFSSSAVECSFYRCWGTPLNDSEKVFAPWWITLALNAKSKSFGIDGNPHVKVVIYA